MSKRRPQSLLEQYPTGFRIGPYHCDKLLGRGAFADVYLGYTEVKSSVVDGAVERLEVAVKVAIEGRTKSEALTMRLHLDTERKILDLLKHKNVIASLTPPQPNVIILDYCNVGTIQSLLAKMKHFSEPVAAHFMRQLVVGMHELRIHHILHRDLKPENLMLQGDDVAPMGMTLKVADFGYACILRPGEFAVADCGSPMYVHSLATFCFNDECRYMAPEILLSRNAYDYKVDVWAMGIILYEMLAGVSPYEKAKSIEDLRRLMAENPVQPPDDVSNDCKAFLSSLLERDPERRASWDQVYRCTWLNASL